MYVYLIYIYYVYIYIYIYAPYCSDHDDLPWSALPWFCCAGLAGGFWSGGSSGPSERRALPYPVQRWEPRAARHVGIWNFSGFHDGTIVLLLSGMTLALHFRLMIF